MGYMRYLSRLVAPVLLLLVASPAHAAETNFFGPIVPSECNCPGAAPDFGCVLQVGQNLLNFGVSLGVIMVTFLIAWAGLMFITNASNPANRQKARNRLLNAALGLVLVLGSWMLVDTIMKALYNENSGFGPWNSIIATSGGVKCVVPTVPMTLGGIIKDLPNAGTGNSSSGTNQPGGAVAGTFSYDPGIKAQVSSASGPLTSLLNCMAGKLPAGVGRISSISDSAIQSGSKTFAQCEASGCSHKAGSCHYGGDRCTGNSYAVDFGDEQNATVLRNTALACGATYTGYEGTHLHVSVGKSCGCN